MSKIIEGFFSPKIEGKLARRSLVFEVYPLLGISYQIPKSFELMPQYAQAASRTCLNFVSKLMTKVRSNVMLSYDLCSKLYNDTGNTSDAKILTLIAGQH